MQRLSDRDFAVWLRNVALAISREARERGITVDVRTEPDGYISTRFGDYEYVKPVNREGGYEYRPLGNVYRWQRHLQPDQIRIGGSPKEKSPEPTKAIRA